MSDTNHTNSCASTRARATEQRQRDRYPQILQDAGLDEEMIERLMADYDDPVVRTTNPVVHQAVPQGLGERENDEDSEIYPEDFGPLPA